MYYTGLDPRTMQPVYVPRHPHEKAMQRALIQYRLPENYDLVKEALVKAGRQDLIGFGPKCLIPPRKIAGKKKPAAHRENHTADNRKKGTKAVSKNTNHPVRSQKTARASFNTKKGRKR